MATKIAGAALIARGVDNCQAGIRQMAGGEPTNTALGDVVKRELQKTMSQEDAAEVGFFVELAVDVALTAKATGQPAKRLPHRVTDPQMADASALIKVEASRRGWGSDIVVRGSRANGTAKLTSDIDFAIRVDRATFDAIVQERFGSPNPGSAKARTIQRAIDTGKIQSGEAGLVPFDYPPTLPVKK